MIIIERMCSVEEFYEMIFSMINHEFLNGDLIQRHNEHTNVVRQYERWQFQYRENEALGDHIRIEKHRDIHGENVQVEYMFEQVMVEKLNEYIWEVFFCKIFLDLCSILEPISWANWDLSLIRFNIRIYLSKY